jgi:hypothetical protein
MSTEYELSRIYAQGWNAALKLTPQQQAVLETRGVAALNPHAGDVRASARWAEGFGRALGVSPRMPMRSADAPGRRGKSA